MTTETPKFDVIFCDPNWEYSEKAPWADSKSGGGATGHYDVADQTVLESYRDQFLAMRPGTEKRPQAGVMLMWFTGPHVETAPKVMRAWGYEPVKPIWYWVKATTTGKVFKGGGHYTQSNIEMVLLGQASKSKRRMPAISSGRAKDEIHFAPHPRIIVPGKRDATKTRSIIEHSRKPDLFLDLARELFGTHVTDPEAADYGRPLLYCEVFARYRYPGYYAIGNQLPDGQWIEPGKVVRPFDPPDGPPSRLILPPYFTA